MRAYDFAPLWRSTIGFDHLLDIFDAAQRAEEEDHYPPYNIERQSEDRYQISLALAGFSPDEITVTAEQNVLSIEGRKASPPILEQALRFNIAFTHIFKRGSNVSARQETHVHRPG